MLSRQPKIHRVSAKAVVVHDGRLLLIKKSDDLGDYFIFPGGGQDHGETLSETLVREVREETGFAVQPLDLIFVRDYIGAHHEFAETSSHFHQVELYFGARLLPSGHGEANLPDSGQTGVEWLPLEDVPRKRVYPLAMREVFVSGHSSRRYVGDVN